MAEDRLADIEERLRSVRGVADAGLTTDDVMRLTRGEEQVGLVGRRLPIGMQTFRKLREEDCYYVDKTAHIARLVERGSHYFLSRPRHFGKSLLLDTLKDLFEGEEALFEGLAIHDEWDWSMRHPVVRLSFGGGYFREPGQVEASLTDQLAAAERRVGLASHHTTAAERFRDLLAKLHRRTGQRVVVLVDEYDKPVLDALDAPDVARANRDFVNGFYGVIKDADAHVRFAFLTGVSRLSTASVFSGLNNLTDVTLDPDFATVCGFTERELDRVFAPELEGLDRRRIRDWYHGYSWLGAERVYNPIAILMLLDRREFNPYWCQTGAPKFLVETLFERRVSSLALEEMVADAHVLSAFDVDHIGTEALLFQTGYLTICGVEDVGGESFYRLGYPNREVKQHLNEHLLGAMGADPSRQGAHDIRLHDLLAANDLAGLEGVFRAFFASVRQRAEGDIAHFEGYWTSLFYSWFAALGLDVTAEDAASGDRLRMVVRFNRNVYLFAFKVVESAPAGAAMAELKEGGYADKYRGRGEPTHLIAIEFSRETRNLTSFAAERG